MTYQNLRKDEVPGSDNEESIDSDSNTSSEGDKSSEEDDIKADGAVIEPITNKPTTTKSDLAEEEVPDSDNEESESDNEESIDGNTDTSSEGDKSSEEDNI